MPIQFIRINNFRNIRDTSFEPDLRKNILVGDNGAGKTSIIEAIYTLARGKSFRTRYIKPVVLEGKPKSILFCTWKNVQGKVLKIGIEKSVSSTRIRVDGQDISRLSRLGQLIPLQLLTPQSVQVFSSGPSFRRKMLDWGVFHVEHSFHNLWGDFLSLLKQRNAALRIKDEHLVAAFTQTLVPLSERIDLIRDKYFIELKEIFIDIVLRTKIFPDLDIAYFRGWNSDIPLSVALRDRYQKDSKRGFTSIGPQYSDIRFFINSKSVDQVLSNGERKILVFLFKVAQLELINRIRPSESIFLLDDVYSELSSSFRNMVNEIVFSLSNQIFITSPDSFLIEPLFERGDSKLFHVEHGGIREG